MYIWFRHINKLNIRCEILDPIKFDNEMDKKIINFCNCQNFAGHSPLYVRLIKIITCVKVYKTSKKLSYGNYTSVKNGNVNKIQLILYFRFHKKRKFVLNLPVHLKVSHINQCSSKPNRGGLNNAQKDLRNFLKSK